MYERALELITDLQDYTSDVLSASEEPKILAAEFRGKQTELRELMDVIFPESSNLR